MAVRKKATKAKATKKTASATKRKTTARKPAARKTTARKPAAKRTVKKAPAKKAVAKKTVAKAAPVKVGNKAFTKSQFVEAVANETGLTKKEVSSVLESIGNVIGAHLKKGSVGTFSLANLCKFVVVKKPATKARKGVNPFTGEPTVFKAKPASRKVKVRPLKALKDMVA